MKFRFYNTQPMYDGEGTGGGAAAPVEVPAAAPAAEAPSTEAPATQEPAFSLEQKLGSMWDEASKPAPTEPAPAGNVDGQTPAAPEPPTQQTPPAKIMNKYDTVDDLVEAHKSLQTTWNKDHQALSTATQELEAAKAQAAALEAKMKELSTPQQQDTQQNQPVEDLTGLDKEALLERLMDDPMSVITKLAEQIADSKLKPLESRINPVIESTEAQRNIDAWTDATEIFKNDHADIADFIPEMKQYIADNNLQSSKDPAKAIADAYAYAKSAAADTKIAAANAKIAELEAKMQANKEDTIKEYLANVRNTQTNIPPSISGNSSSNAPAMPPVRAGSIAEATKRAADRIFGG